MIKSKPLYIVLRSFSAVLSVVLIAMSVYTLFVFSTIPFIAYWRTIWIETAMTTGSHAWLATAFIPEEIIESIMDNSAGNPDVIGGQSYLKPVDDNNQNSGQVSQGTSQNTDISEVLPDTGDESSADKNEISDDILGQKNITVGKKDYAGYTVLINDIEQGIVVSEITGSGFKGRIMLIDDPSRVYLASTPNKGVEGLRIKKMMSEYDAVAGINASGFMDHAGEGSGGEVVGLSCSQGEYWGEYVDYYGSVVITGDNRLVVGNISVWQNYDIRDGIQFGPVLVADGKAQVTGSAGYGLQPRTAIGQREDGVIVFLVIDGRDLTWSVGCTVGDMAEILLKYGVVNAACCDGGSSSVMAYNGEILNRNSSANPSYGRRLPNAFLVKPKQST